jgi:hypothetical protein
LWFNLIFKKIFMSADVFEQFRKNLEIQNSEQISTWYAEITKRLNRDFWDSDSESTHCLQVGSYGRHTAIRGVSDLDMVFELPQNIYEQYSKLEGNGPSKLLQAVKNSVLARYPNTSVSGDGQVVVVEFNNHRVEILPGFLQNDGAYRYGDTHDGGTWDNYCAPRAEIREVNTANQTSNRNLKRICKMLRAWKNKHGAPMNGMLIDTLAYKFFAQNKEYDSKSYSSYPTLVKDVFVFLSNLEKKDYWLAPGSRSRVYSKGNFQRKAKKAAEKCLEALDEIEEEKRAKIWRSVFGSRFPNIQAVTESKALAKSYGKTQTSEQFIEDLYPVDIQYELELECDVAYAGRLENRYRWLEATFPWLQLGRSLTFKVASCNAPPPCQVLWKVRNRGPYAEAHNQIRGKIENDTGRWQKVETSSFGGRHYVECYIVKDRVCVAREIIDVPLAVS